MSKIRANVQLNAVYLASVLSGTTITLRDNDPPVTDRIHHYATRLYTKKFWLFSSVCFKSDTAVHWRPSHYTVAKISFQWMWIKETAWANQWFACRFDDTWQIGTKNMWSKIWDRFPHVRTVYCHFWEWLTILVSNVQNFETQEKAINLVHDKDHIPGLFIGLKVLEIKFLNYFSFFEGRTILDHHGKTFSDFPSYVSDSVPASTVKTRFKTQIFFSWPLRWHSLKKGFSDGELHLGSP